MRRGVVAVVSVCVLGVAVSALATSGYFARLFVDGVEVASQELTAGPHDVDVVVDGPGGTLLEETFQVVVPDHIVIDQDTTLTDETMVLRAGDSVEFRNGATLTIGAGASVDWQGTPTSTWSDDGLTQNLERDVDIFGAGDIMFAAGSQPSTIRFVEIDLQPLQELDHYPLHWHHAGDGSRGTLVEGVVVRDSTNRAFVPHASHGITFRDVIAKNTVGEPLWWNPGDSSHDLLFDHVLLDGVTNAVGDNRGFRLSAALLGAGQNDTIVDSVARNIHPSHPKNCSGWHWPEKSGGIWTFERNATFGSDCTAIFVWQNNSNLHTVTDFRAADGGAIIEHGAYKNRYSYENVDVRGFLVHALGWTTTGGSADVVHFRRHNESSAGERVVFTDVAVETIKVNNAHNSGSVPGDYVFTGSGATCADVLWMDYVPGTQLSVDGAACAEGG